MKKEKYKERKQTKDKKIINKKVIEKWLYKNIYKEIIYVNKTKTVLHYLICLVLACLCMKNINEVR